MIRQICIWNFIVQSIVIPFVRYKQANRPQKKGNVCIPVATTQKSFSGTFPLIYGSKTVIEQHMKTIQVCKSFAISH